MSPGWYPAPDGNGRQWWNGVGWSDSRQGGTAAVPPVPVPTVRVPPRPPAVPLAAKPPVYSAQNPPPLAPGHVPPARVFGSRTTNVSINRNAMIGFVTGLVALFFNVLFVLAPIAIVFSIMGLSRARQLRAQGATTTLGVYAGIGLATGLFSALVGIIQVVVFLVSMFGVDVVGSALFPASGILPWMLQR